MPKFLGLIISTALFLITAKSAFAVIIKIPDYPPTITQDPFAFTVSIEGAQTATNYLRVDLFKEDSSSYFGDTYNGKDWYNGSDGKQYFPISIQSNQVWTGQIEARVGEPSASKYTGSGTYKMRIRRYTASGGQGGENANDSSVSININFNNQSPTPAPQNSTTQSTSSISSKSKSSSPSPKSVSLVIPTSSPKTTLGEKVESQEVIASQSSTVLESSSPIATPTPEIQNQDNAKTKIANVAIGIGISLIGLSAMVYLILRKKMLHQDDSES